MFFVIAEKFLTEQFWLLKVTQYSSINIAGLFSCAVSLVIALIIISDCLCQQWLDRTHQVTNPIKLIIQVLTMLGSTDTLRGAVLSPTWMKNNARIDFGKVKFAMHECMNRLWYNARIDFGKVKFGGPFTEEEVEDVKTILQLVPIVCCISFIASMSWNSTTIDLSKNSFINEFVYVSIHTWFFLFF